jgi:uncharacterized protein
VTSARVSVPRALALGVGAGLLSGLFGVGGGVVLVPGLVLLGLVQHRAHATSLAAIIVTAAGALQPFAADGAVHWSGGAVVAVGAIAGANLGAAIMHRLSPTRLRQAFAVLVVLVALRMLWPDPLPSAGAAPELGAGLIAGLALLGVAAGTLSAVMGVGGGVILVPALALLFGFGQHLAEGTSLLVIIPTAVMGAIRHASHGYTDWRTGLLVGTAGLGGGQVGARAALALDEGWLTVLFAVFLLLMGVRLLLSATREARTRRAEG